MIVDYERIKNDLTFHIQKNEEVVRELQADKHRRQVAESEVEKLRREYEEL